MKDFFISYTKVDRAWAEWIAWQLEAAGYTTVLQVWDFRPGSNFVQEMHQAAIDAQRTLAVLSPDYINSSFTPPEWAAAFAKDPRGEKGLLLPVRVCECKLEGLLPSIINIDLVGLEESDAKDKLLAGVSRERVKPALPPTYPGNRPFFPGSKQAKVDPTVSVPLQSLEPLRKIGNPPSKLWARTKGWIDYRMSREQRHWLINEYKNKGIKQELLQMLKTQEFESSIQYHQLSSRPPIQEILNYNDVIITGPAGVGKTTFLSEIFRKRLQSEEVDMFIVLQFADILEAKQNPLSLWERINQFFQYRRNKEFRPLTPAAIAYALLTRPILLVIEDLHGAGSIEDLYFYIQNYFETYHEWNQQLKLLLTTRESMNFSRRGIEVISLKPLEKNEARDFFVTLCLKKGVQIDQSAISEALREGEGMRRAFETPATCTPLFVAICVWLVINKSEYRQDVSRLLRMSVSEVIQAFINALYDRAQTNGVPDVEAFQTAYEIIALESWPKTDIQEREIKNWLQDFLPFKENAITVQFFEKNSFLVRQEEKDFVKDVLSFPHQSIVDYLAAKRMVNTDNFSPLMQKEGLLSGLVDFIAELIDSNRKLIAFVRSNLPAFIEVISLHPELLYKSGMGNRNELSQQLAEALSLWIIADTFPRQSTETWDKLRNALKSWSSQWIDHLNNILESYDALSRAIEVLAAIGNERSVKLLKRWMVGDAAKMFQDIAELPPVNTFLLGVLSEETLQTSEGRTAFDLLWSSPSRKVKAGVEDWFNHNVQKLKINDINTLVERGSPFVKLIAEGCKALPLDSKRRISSIIAERIDKFVIPPGSYKVKKGKKEATVTIDRSYLVPRKYKIKRTAKDLLGLQNAMPAIRKAVNNLKLMTEDQFLVAFYNFSEDPSNRNNEHSGIIFSGKDQYYPEVISNSPGQIDIMDFISNTELEGPADRRIINSFAYREVELL
jgi:hypothetical protein